MGKGKSMGLLASLSREQKESIVLLQMGTFLEYFDLMLYVHMAVLLNELFFPKYDPLTTSIVTATTFCLTFLFRPIGALVFGWIGDRIGRKQTIMITTFMMAISCIIMANLPTYAQIGITAAWIMMFCRILQGMSSMGEMIGAQIYLTESIERPTSYPIVASLNICSGLGIMVALGVATLVTTFPGLNWRFAFWIGTTIAVISFVARTRLRETPEFLEMQRRWLKNQVEEANLEADAILGIDEGAKTNATWKEPISAKTLASYFFISCGTALCFYLGFVYFNPILQENFGYSSEDIIRHNFFLSMILVISNILLTCLSCYIHPLRILKIMGVYILLLLVSMPYWIMTLTTPLHLFLIQALILLLPLHSSPANAIFMSHFPLYRRFTYASLLFSFAQALVAAIASYGLIYLGNYFGHYSLWIIPLPIAVAYLYGVFHFTALEHRKKLYRNSLSLGGNRI
jgi:MHS family proline/betaine transporter-like MFS transporter